VGPADLPPGALRAVRANDVPLRLAAGDGEVCAISNQCGDGPLPRAMDAARRDLEAALREGLLGFQELVLDDRPATARPDAAIPLAMLRRAHRPVYVDVGPADLPPGALRAVRANDVPLRLAAEDGEVCAISNQCGDGPLPLEFSTLDGPVLRCSWHGCRYDVRSGKRLDDDGDRLRAYPVSVEEGRIRVALDVAPALDDA
jgi:nitrite reductase/ring-hydroxylating ferredoxin subunit